MITRTIDNFDLRQIAESGQCFRMTEIAPAGMAVGSCFGTEDGVYRCRIISGARMVLAAQRGRQTVFFCGEDEFPYWEDYFDLKTDYGAFISAVDPQDLYLKAAAEAGRGIRILRQDAWEMLITFVISQQKTIPNIRALVEALCARYGTRMELFGKGQAEETVFYSFPTPAQLSRASLDDLLSLKLGYRAKYIKRICGDVCSAAADLDLLRRMSCSEALKYLEGLYGVGRKVANCVCLFGLHHIEAFPVDTWIRRILEREYACRCRGAGLDRIPESKRCEYLVSRCFGRYEGFAGVMQQYMFYYERTAAPH